MKHFLLANGRKVAVQFFGKTISSDSVPLVLLHGFCEDSSLWEGLLQQLKEIPMVAIDLPGFGQSDMPVTPSMDAYAQAVLETLDTLELPLCILLGHSLGGYVALEFAARWGQRLAGMGLFHSHPFPDNEERKAARMRGIEMLQSGKRNLYVAQLFPNLFTPQFAKAHPEIVNALISRGQQQSAEGIIAALQAMISRTDHQKTLRNLACPALFLLGAEDGLVPINQAWVAALLPNISAVEIMQGVAHMGMYEACNQSASALRSFCQLANSFP